MHVSDLESGAVIEAGAREGKEADTPDLNARGMVAIGTKEEVCTNTAKEKLATELAAHKGYFAIKEIGVL